MSAANISRHEQLGLDEDYPLMLSTSGSCSRCSHGVVL